MPYSYHILHFYFPPEKSWGATNKKKKKTSNEEREEEQFWGALFDRNIIVLHTFYNYNTESVPATIIDEQPLHVLCQYNLQSLVMVMATKEMQFLPVSFKILDVDARENVFNALLFSNLSH